MRDSPDLTVALGSAETAELVTILLATRNGEAFLDEQIGSLAEQTHPRMDIWASDDGSTDRTIEILKDWKNRWAKGRFHISGGPRKGFSENFRSLVSNESVEADFIAFCDQDDIWEPHKLESALEWMRRRDRCLPLMFCSRTLNISETGEPLSMSPIFSCKPSFRNALVQSLAGGNTMVLNHSAWQLVKRASSRSEFVSHDWWAYLIVSGSGGVVRYSSEPLVRYRQHANNLVGANRSWQARVKRIRSLLDGQFVRWNDENLRGLEHNRDMLTADALAVVERFRSARCGGLVDRLVNLSRSGVYRQTLFGTVALWMAATIRRM